MRFVYSSLNPWSRALVGINNTSIFRLAFSNFAVGFSTALYRCFAKHCCWHRNFQLSTSGFDCELEFFIVRFNKEHSSQYVALSSFGFSMALFCFAFFFTASDIRVHISGLLSSGREVFYFSCKSPPGPCVSIRWPLVQ